MRHVECLDPVDLVIFPESQNLSIQRNITLFHPLPSRRLEWKPQLHHRCVLEPAVRGMSSTRCSIGYPVSKILSPTVRQTLPWMTESSMMGFSGQQSYRGLRSMRRSHQLPESIKEDTGSKCGERELRGNCGGGPEDQVRRAWLYSGDSGEKRGALELPKWIFDMMEFCFGKRSWAWWADLGADTRWQSWQLSEYCSHQDKKLRCWTRNFTPRMYCIEVNT